MVVCECDVYVTGVVCDVRLKKTGKSPLVTCLNVLGNMNWMCATILMVVFNA